MLNPIILNNIDLVIEEDDYAASVSRAVITPTTPTAKWKGMKKGSGVNLVGDPDWVLGLTFAQDHDAEDSLSNYLLDNLGEVKEVTLRPKSGGKGYKVAVVMLPGAIGGDLSDSSAATATADLPVNGQPERVVAPGAS